MVVTACPLPLSPPNLTRTPRATHIFSLPDRPSCFPASRPASIDRSLGRESPCASYVLEHGKSERMHRLGSASLTEQFHSH